MYDNLYCFSQHNPKHIFQLTVGVFRIFLPDFPSLKIYLDIYSAAFGTYKIGKKLRLSLKFFLDMLLRSHPRAAITAALQQLSFGNLEINSGYCYPEDMEKLSFYKKPFIFDGNNFVCLNLNFFSAGFYSSIYDVSEKQGITSSDIGDSAEEYLAELFQIHGVSLFPEKKYKISGTVRKKLAINKREGECDFIIETENTIVFLELKKKPLTAQARAGDIVQATLDLSTSLFHGLAQTGWHELILRSEKEIVFENGAKLSLNNRKIERVAVSLSEFFSIDDSNFVHELLRNLIGARISSIEEEIPSKIHKYLDELNFQYETEFFKSEYNDLKNRFWNCSFFSIEQLMVILNHSTGNSSFCDELFAARTFTVNSSDWYRDYFHKKSLLPHHDAVTSV